MFKRPSKVEVSPEQVRDAVAAYLDNLPEDKAARLVARIVGAQGLTEQAVRRMVESVKGDRFIEITFGNGDVATISNRTPREKAGPGW